MFFSEAILNFFGGVDSKGWMIAAFPSKSSIDKILEYRNSLDLEGAEKLLPAEELHCTLRYWKEKDFDDVRLVKQFLSKNIEGSNYKCSVTKLGLLGKDNAVVLHLDCPELNKIQNKIDDGIQDVGVPESDYSTFKAHLSLAYGYPKDEINSNKDFNFDIELDEIRLVTNEDKVLWKI